MTNAVVRPTDPLLIVVHSSRLVNVLLTQTCLQTQGQSRLTDSSLKRKEMVCNKTPALSTTPRRLHPSHPIIIPTQYEILPHPRLIRL